MTAALRTLSIIGLLLLLGLIPVSDLSGRNSGPSRIRFGFASSLLEDINPDDALASTKVWAETLGVQEGLWEESDAQIFQNYSSLAQKVNGGEVDIVAIPNCDYIRLEEELLAKPLITYVLGDRLEVEYILLVHHDAGIETLADLQGKRAALLSKGGANSLAVTWLDVLLMDDGFESHERFFKEVKNIRKPSQAILPVFFDQLDAAAVSQMTTGQTEKFSSN